MEELSLGSPPRPTGPEESLPVMIPEEQVARLVEFFPECDFGSVQDQVTALREIRPTAHRLRNVRLLVVPKLTAVQPVTQRNGWAPINHVMERLQWIMNEVEPNRLIDHTMGRYGPEALRLTACTNDALQRIGESVKGDALVLPVCLQTSGVELSTPLIAAGFGRGRFGLDPFTVGCFLLTHDARFHFGTRCVGAEATGEEEQFAYDDFSRTPVWAVSLEYEKRTVSYRCCDDRALATAFALNPLWWKEHPNAV